jgi:hypothetical protein
VSFEDDTTDNDLDNSNNEAINEEIIQLADKIDDELNDIGDKIEQIPTLSRSKRTNETRCGPPVYIAVNRLAFSVCRSKTLRIRTYIKISISVVCLFF